MCTVYISVLSVSKVSKTDCTEFISMLSHYQLGVVTCCSFSARCRDIIGREAIIDWWHGKGGMLDYTNPDAVDWWHKQMDQVCMALMDCGGIHRVNVYVPLGEKLHCYSIYT